MSGCRSSRRRFLRAAGGLGAILATGYAPGLRAAVLGARRALQLSNEEGIYACASTLAEAIRTKTISAVELAESCLARIARVNPQINAVCAVAQESAILEARKADQELSTGKLRGPLHGVPFTVKDALDTAGMTSTGGTTGRARFVPEADATAVARVRAAGAILLGKTNTPELTLSYETDNLLYGRTNNPYDLTRTAGGSSGGSAAVIAVGGSPFDLGTDTAGSIRVPSHFCGIAGMKPTSGRVSNAGNILPPGGLIGDWTQIGPMARSVEDLALILSVISGPDPRDPDAVPSPLGDYRKVEARALRARFFTANGSGIPATPEAAAAVKNAAAALAKSGLAVSEGQPDGFELAAEIMATVNCGDGGNFYRQLLQRYGTTTPHPQTAHFLQQSRSGVISGRKYSDVLRQWAELRQSMMQFVNQLDLLICPPCSGPAPRHSESSELDFSYASFFNVLGWPAAVIRTGKTVEGLPLGVQIVGRPWKEHEVLAAAALLERELGGWKADFPEKELLSGNL